MKTSRLHDVVTSLDKNSFRWSTLSYPGCKTIRRRPTAQRGYQDLSDNYQAMKRLYANPNRLVDQYSSQIQNLKAQHLRLIQSLQKT